MTKNKFLSKRLACLLTTALVSLPIQVSISHAEDFTIANGITVTAADNNGTGDGATAIVNTDAVTLGGATAGINTEAAAITVASIATGATNALTLSGTGGLVVTTTITAGNTHALTINLGTANLSVGTNMAVDGTGTIATNLDGRTLTFNTNNAGAVASTINGAGTVAIAANTKTINGVVGGTTAITSITTAAGSTGVFTANVTGTGAYTGTTTGAVQFGGATTTMGSYLIGNGGTITANRNGAQTITGTIDASTAADQGTLVINNAGGTVTIASAVGSTRSLALITGTTSATFSSNVSTLALTAANGTTQTLNGNFTIGATDAVLTGSGTLAFAGTAGQTVNAVDNNSVIRGNAANGGIVSVTNTHADGVTFNNTFGTGAALGDLVGAANTRIILKNNTNLINEVQLAAGAALEFKTDAFTNTGTLITTTAADFALVDVNATAQVKLPVNFVGGNSMNLFHTTANDVVAADGLTQLNSNVQDSVLVDYVVTKDAGANIAVVTATDKSSSVIASAIGTNTNKAAALLNARDAAIAGDSTLMGTLDTMLKNTSDVSSERNFANQVAPQTDTITGSTIAAKAVTSGVQNVIATRLASLRSGDAYSTGIVTGNHMGANSGFIQAFGSQVEQKNKGNEFGYDADTTGFAIGFDTKIPGGAVIGISYAHSEADVDGKGTGRAKNDIKTDSVSLYADYATKDGYVEGSITYGKSDNKGSRIINTADLNRTYSSNYDSEQYSFRLSGGIPQSLGGGAFITPFAAATISQIKADAYTETSTTANDALRLRVSQDTVDSQVGTVGVKFHQAIKDGKTTFTPEVKLAVNQEFGDGNITTTNTYQGGGASFKNSTAIEKTSATAGLGLNISSDNVSFNIGYEADVKEKYLGHSAQAKITAKF